MEDTKHHTSALDTFLKEHSHVNVVTIEGDIKRIFGDVVAAKKYVITERLAEKINTNVRNHVITNEMTDREKEIWDICISHVTEALFEEMIHTTEQERDF